ncbi:hypothetical protein N7486_007865 [Penicillium sp. IBT 16267x]|nr:hypothetical protein N7486_007865 [Penicillium sp. IBT 16267x]
MSFPTPSMLVFGPQASTPSSETLSQLRSLLGSDSKAPLKPIRDAVRDIATVWPTLAASGLQLNGLPGAQYIQQLLSLVTSQEAETATQIDNLPSTVMTPLTVLLHLTQYLLYADGRSPNGISSHAQIIDQVRPKGGIQGFCTGLLSAVAIGISRDEEALAGWIGTALKLATAIGACVDADARGPSSDETGCVVVKWTSEEGKTQLLGTIDQIPGAYISVYPDGNAATITAPLTSMNTLTQAIQAHKLVSISVDMRGRFHTADHQTIADKLKELCATVPELQLPRALELSVPILGNDGRTFPPTCFLHDILIDAIQAIGT